MPNPMHRVAILRAACCIAGLDEEVCGKERPMLAKLATYAGVGTASLEAMIERARTDPRFYEEQFEIVNTDAESTVTSLFCVACADGELTPTERIILHHFAQKLGLSDERFNQILAAAEKRVAK